MRFTELSQRDRAETLNEASLQLGLAPLVIEKDFWVCWTLGLLFGDSNLSRNLMFKGGTSLAMVFGAIRRFSEDIDLGFAPAEFGVDEAELSAAPSNKKRQRGSEALAVACASHVEHHVRPALKSAITRRLGVATPKGEWLAFQYDEATRSANLFFEYPSAMATPAGYIRKVIKLEFGSLTNQRPQGRHRATPLIARTELGPFEDAGADVVVLELERTFWEKATILHSEFHRPLEKPLRDRGARHYHDFAMLWRHESRERCLVRLDLLRDVARHKELFFSTPWTNYAGARPGALRLVPPRERSTELRLDYERMAPMFMEPPEPFAQVLGVLAEAEQTINRP